jgi:hypothetical protein
MSRPQTGFKQKSGEDLMSTNFANIEQYTDLLYEEKFEDKVKGARSLLVLLADPTNIYHIVTEKLNLIDTISRTLKDEHKNNIELLIHLLAFFYCFSNYEEFHEMLVDHSIGETCLNIIDFQYAKFTVRKLDIIKKQQLVASNPTKELALNYKKDLDKFLFLVRKQDRILKLAFTILMHLAEDPKIEKKMVKRDIVKIIVKNLDRTNVNLIVTMLLFLKKLSIYDVNKEALIKCDVLDELVK